MSFKRTVAITAAAAGRLILYPMGLKFRALFNETLDRWLIYRVETPRGSLSFFCPNLLTHWRAEKFLSKEPETLEWIDGFNDGDVLWDIGANVGVYAIYAALNPTIKVVCIEPMPGNYSVLCRNIEINNMGDQISALCIALTDKKELGYLNMTSTITGSALASFQSTLDPTGNTFTPTYRQAMLGNSIDGFINEYDPPFPNRLKIDVDGIELQIITGGRKTLADPRLKSVSVELDDDSPDLISAVTKIMEESGLPFLHKKIEPSMLPDGMNLFNYVFARS